MRSLVVVPAGLWMLAITTSANGAVVKHTNSLKERYARLSCAVVQIVHDGGMGTGFFISADGDVLTAAHVAVDRRFYSDNDTDLLVEVRYKPGLRIVRNGAPPAPLKLPKPSVDDVLRATADLTILRTGIKSPCYLQINNRDDISIGDHVVAIGFPISAPSGALYEGFVSARYRHLPIPIAVVKDRPVYPSYEVLRVQMPITPGASGGPIVADDDTVVGVISENPTIWFADLNDLIASGQANGGGFNAPNADLPKLTAKLAWVVQEFATSGAGLAVPVSYLRVPVQSRTQPEKPKSSAPAPVRHREGSRSSKVIQK